MAVKIADATRLILQDSVFRAPAFGKFQNFAHGISRRRAPKLSPLRELNLRPDAEVDGEYAARHRILLCDALKISLDKTVWFDPATPGPVQLATRAECGRGSRDWETRWLGTSGLVAIDTDVFPATLLNDNVVVLLFDPRWHVTAIVSIDPLRRNVEAIMEAVNLMTNQGGSERKEMVALISPSLGPCCCEFDDPALPDAYVKTNLWDTVRGALAHAGILRNRQINPRICTSCKPFDFYSVLDGGQGAGANAIVAGTRDADGFGEVLARRRANAAVHRKPQEERDRSLAEISLSIEERRLNGQIQCPYGRNKVYIRSVLTGDAEAMVEQPVISLRCAVMEHVGLALGGYNIVGKDYIEQYCCKDYRECEAHKRFAAKRKHFR